MIIGQFTDSFPPIADGVARVVQNYALWQHKDGDTCYVITPGVPGYSYLPFFQYTLQKELPNRNTAI
jgi:hypothetical protein